MLVKKVPNAFRRVLENEPCPFDPSPLPFPTQYIAAWSPYGAHRSPRTFAIVELMNNGGVFYYKQRCVFFFNPSHERVFSQNPTLSMHSFVSSFESIIPSLLPRRQIQETSSTKETTSRYFASDVSVAMSLCFWAVQMTTPSLIIKIPVVKYPVTGPLSSYEFSECG